MQGDGCVVDGRGGSEDAVDAGERQGWGSRGDGDGARGGVAGLDKWVPRCSAGPSPRATLVFATFSTVHPTTCPMQGLLQPLQRMSHARPASTSPAHVPCKACCNLSSASAMPRSSHGPSAIRGE